MDVILTAKSDLAAQRQAQHATDLLDRALTESVRLAAENESLRHAICRLQLEAQQRPATDGYRRRFHVLMAVASAMLVALAYAVTVAVSK